jgi:hypothetical protein
LVADITLSSFSSDILVYLSSVLDND